MYNINVGNTNIANAILVIPILVLPILVIPILVLPILVLPILVIPILVYTKICFWGDPGGVKGGDPGARALKTRSTQEPENKIAMLANDALGGL